ncbi:MAG TPA: thioesterase family protein [Anaerolineae bacterium]
MRETRHSFRVMTYDIDFAGVVSNQVYVRWLEDLRNLFADQALSLSDAVARGIVPVLARTEIDYLAPARFPDTIDGHMWLEDTGRAKWVLGAEFVSRANGQVTAKARQFGVFVSMESGRPVPLPEEFRSDSHR